MADNPLGATLAAVLLFAVGLAQGGSLIYINLHERDRFAGWSRADGKVTEVLTRTSAGREVFMPRVLFTTGGGERISFTLPAARRAAYAVNDTVPVLYLEYDPRTA